MKKLGMVAYFLWTLTFVVKTHRGFLNSTGLIPQSKTFHPQVEAYMMARMASLRPGDDVGVFAHQLPNRRRPELPAPLPEWVKKHAAKDPNLKAIVETCAEPSGVPEAEEDMDEEGEEEEYIGEDEDDDNDLLPDDGWYVKKSKKVWSMGNTHTGKIVEIGPPEDAKGKWVVYNDNGVDMIWQGEEAKDDMDAIGCADFFNEIWTGEDTAKIGALPTDLQESQRLPHQHQEQTEWCKTSSFVFKSINSSTVYIYIIFFRHVSIVMYIKLLYFLFLARFQQLNRCFQQLSHLSPPLVSFPCQDSSRSCLMRRRLIRHRTLA